MSPELLTGANRGNRGLNYLNNWIARYTLADLIIYSIFANAGMSFVFFGYTLSALVCDAYAIYRLCTPSRK